MCLLKCGFWISSLLGVSAVVSEIVKMSLFLARAHHRKKFLYWRLPCWYLEVVSLLIISFHFLDPVAQTASFSKCLGHYPTKIVPWAVLMSALAEFMWWCWFLAAKLGMLGYKGLWKASKHIRFTEIISFFGNEKLSLHPNKSIFFMDK